MRRTVGTLIGRIQTFQDLMNETPSRKEDLAKMSLVEPRKQAQKFQSRLRRIKSGARPLFTSIHQAASSASLRPFHEIEFP